MNKSITPLAFALLLGLCAVSIAQFPTDQRIYNRLGPPELYSFQSAGPNYSPYQFNWYNGRWDYVPVPYPSAGWGAGPYRFNAYSGKWDYSPVTAPPGQILSAPLAPAPAAPALGAATLTIPAAPLKTDDSDLWRRPSTQPSAAARVAKVHGEIVAIRAAGLRGEPFPHLLVRLKAADGKFTTVDVGDRLELPGGAPLSGADGQMTATGVMGTLDGSPVLFADHVTLGGQSVTVERGGQK